MFISDWLGACLFFIGTLLKKSNKQKLAGRPAPRTKREQNHKRISKRDRAHLFASHSCVANFPRSLLHLSFFVSFLRFSRQNRPSSSLLFLFLTLSSLCQNFQLLGLLALRLAFPSTASAPNRSSPSLRFNTFTSSAVSGSRLARNSRTRRKRGTEEEEEEEERFFSIFFLSFPNSMCLLCKREEDEQEQEQEQENRCPCLR